MRLINDFTINPGEIRWFFIYVVSENASVLTIKYQNLSSFVTKFLCYFYIMEQNVIEEYNSSFSVEYYHFIYPCLLFFDRFVKINWLSAKTLGTESSQNK